MPSSLPPTVSRFFDPAAWLPRRRALLWMLLAFVAGLLLFALVWSRGQDDADVASSAIEVAPAVADTSDYQPLPAPLPARPEGGTGTDSPPPRDDGAPRARLVETAPPPQPTSMPQPPPIEPSPPPSVGGYVSPQPIAGRSPPPEYPRRALRRGERGTVTIRAEIGPDGVPISVSVASSSGSRQLDRAAADAVRRWRFRPAMRNGRPTTGSIVVPINFDPG